MDTRYSRGSTCHALLTLVALMAWANAPAAPADDLAALMRDYWAWTLEENPILATTVGVRDYDAELPDLSLVAEDRRENDRRAFLARLDAIPPDALGAEDRVNLEILRRLLAEGIEGNHFGQRAQLFTTYSGWHQDFADLATRVPLATSADFASYIARLKKYPALSDAAMAVSDVAIEGGYTLPCAVLDGYETTISGVITDDPRDSRFYEPFRRPLLRGCHRVEPRAEPAGAPRAAPQRAAAQLQLDRGR